ncbi:hypothetical protein ACROYT_G015301 [Oculina patagonica]
MCTTVVSRHLGTRLVSFLDLDADPWERTQRLVVDSEKAAGQSTSAEQEQGELETNGTTSEKELQKAPIDIVHETSKNHTVETEQEQVEGVEEVQPTKQARLPNLQHMAITAGSHCKKNQHLPIARIQPLVEMAKHKDSTRGKKRVIVDNDQIKQAPGRARKVCALCDKVVLYFSTHLQQTHGLKRESTQYQFAVKKSRKYKGASEEIKWDKSLVKAKKRKAEVNEDDYDDDLVPLTKKKPSIGLMLLEAEMQDSEDSSDEDFQMPYSFKHSKQVDEVVHPTPQKEKSSIMPTPTQTSRDQDEGDGVQPDRASEEDTQEGNIAEDDDNEEDWDIEEEEEDQSSSEDDETWIKFYQKKKNRPLMTEISFS